MEPQMEFISNLHSSLTPMLWVNGSIYQLHDMLNKIFYKYWKERQQKRFWQKGYNFIKHIISTHLLLGESASTQG